MVRSRKSVLRQREIGSHRSFRLHQGNYYIAFNVLTTSMEDTSVIHIKGIKVVNTILNYAYLGLLLMSFILALGNRPQGSKRSYTLAFIGFAFITIYMTVSTVSYTPASVCLSLRWTYQAYLHF